MYGTEKRNINIINVIMSLEVHSKQDHAMKPLGLGEGGEWD